MVLHTYRRDRLHDKPLTVVRIFRAIIAPFILFLEILDLSRDTAPLETCSKARRLPERGNADTEIINSVVTKRRPKWREERRVRIEAREREAESSIAETESSKNEDMEKHKDVRVHCTEPSG